jgi:excisionase family DNA binding protein
MDVTMASAEDILTIAELSAHLRVHPTTIYRLLREGRIPGFRVGSAWRFSRAAIEVWEHEQVGPIDGDGHSAPPARKAKGRKPRK